MEDHRDHTVYLRNLATGPLSTPLLVHVPICCLIEKPGFVDCENYLSVAINITA